MKQKILVIGKLPPPLGGVSIYVRRRCRELELMGNSVTRFTSQPGFFNFLQFCLTGLCRRYNLVEINSSQYIWVFVNKVLFPTAKIIVIDHNSSGNFGNVNFLLRVFCSFSLLLADRIDLVRDSLTENYTRLFFFEKYRFALRDPFLLPSPDEGLQAIKSWPASLMEFIDGQKQLIVSCAFTLDLRNDIYKFDK